MVDARCDRPLTTRREGQCLTCAVFAVCLCSSACLTDIESYTILRLMFMRLDINKDEDEDEDEGQGAS